MIKNGADRFRFLLFDKSFLVSKKYNAKFGKLL
jgi:hypothetical protein